MDTTTSKQSSHAPTNTRRGSRRLVRRKKKDRCNRRRHHKAGRRSTAKETMAANTDATTIGNKPWRARYPEPQTSAYKLQIVGAVQTTEDEEDAGGTELSKERAKAKIAGRVGNKKTLAPAASFNMGCVSSSRIEPLPESASHLSTYVYPFAGVPWMHP
jgi:hypothetical protein